MFAVAAGTFAEPNLAVVFDDVEVWAVGGVTGNAPRAGVPRVIVNSHAARNTS